MLGRIFNKSKKTNKLNNLSNGVRNFNILGEKLYVAIKQLKDDNDKNLDNINTAFEELSKCINTLSSQTGGGKKKSDKKKSDKKKSEKKKSDKKKSDKKKSDKKKSDKKK